MGRPRKSKSGVAVFDQILFGCLFKIRAEVEHTNVSRNLGLDHSVAALVLHSIYKVTPLIGQIWS